jgi:predicted AlkP superfamily phosphohydrolase/phosphomutase
MHSRPPKRLMVLGYDAMDVELVRRWALAGFLPTFRRLFESSAWTEYIAPPEYSSGTMWPSINTGVGPRQHDFYSFGRFCEGSYRLRMARANDVRKEPFWKSFAQSGLRIILADIPFSVPNPEYGGKQFWGWNVHDNWAWEKSSVPSQLLSKLSGEFGSHPVSSCSTFRVESNSLYRLRLGLLKGIERRTAIFKSMIAQSDWDFFYGAYSETHCAGHRMWHLEDESHPQHHREQVAIVGHGLRDVYKAIDNSLGELIACVGDNVNCLIFFSHGMGPNYHGAHLFPEFVDRFNYHWAGKTLWGRNPAIQGGWLDSVWHRTVRRMPDSWRNQAKLHLPISVRGWITLQRLQDSKRWSTMPAFSLPKDGFSVLRVNLVGREPQGRICPGKEYGRYLDAFISELYQLTNVETGQPVVERVFRVDQQAEPLRIGAGTDLVVWWSKSGPIREIRSPNLGIISGQSFDDRTGEHVMRGMILISDRKAKRGHHILEGVKAEDITATLYELAQIKPGDILEGKSLCCKLLSESG